MQFGFHTMEATSFMDLFVDEFKLKGMEGIDDISFMDLTSEDVVRHRLVSEIVDAYGRFDSSIAGTRADRRENKPRSLRSDR